MLWARMPIAYSYLLCVVAPRGRPCLSCLCDGASLTHTRVSVRRHGDISDMAPPLCIIGGLGFGVTRAERVKTEGEGVWVGLHKAG